MWQFPQVSDDEGLRLIVAFLQITDPNVRAALVCSAERAAANAVPVVQDAAALRQDNDRDSCLA